MAGHLILSLIFQDMSLSPGHVRDMSGTFPTKLLEYPAENNNAYMQDKSSFHKKISSIFLQNYMIIAADLNITIMTNLFYDNGISKFCPHIGINIQGSHLSGCLLGVKRILVQIPIFGLHSSVCDHCLSDPVSQKLVLQRPSSSKMT